MKSEASRAADAQMGCHFVEVKSGVQSIRSLRDAIIHVAYQLAERPSGNALLVLPGLQLTQMRLKEEQEKALKAFRPEIMKRLKLVLVDGGEYRNLPARFSPSDRLRLDQLIKEETARHGERLPRIDGYYVILKILVLQWLKTSRL